MGFTKTTVWEIDDAGTVDGGGSFNTASAGVDYSQQAAPELTLSDVVTDGTTTILSATGGFTANMVGNGMSFDHLPASVSRREIITFTDTNTIIVNAGVAADTGITVNVGGAISVPNANTWGSSAVAAGHIIYIKKGVGDYVMTEALTGSTDGTLADGWIEVIGYNTTRGDNPTGTDRPTIDFGASYVYTVDDRWKNKDLHIDYGGTASFFRFDVLSVVENCYIELTTSGAAPRALYNGSGTGSAIGCEVSAASASTGSANAMDQGGGTPCLYHGNYVRDYDSSGYAIDLLTAVKSMAMFNIIDTCTNGIKASTAALDYGNIINNTIYNCTIGINFDSGDTVIKNNVIDTCVTGINNSGGDAYVDIDWNNYNGNTADVAGFTLDTHNDQNRTANDPSFTAAGTGDFSNSLDPADAMILGGFTSNIRQGAIQLPAAAAGAGACDHGFVN